MGYFLYVDGEPARWCQCGPRDRLAELVSQYRLDPDPAVWAITCFFVIPARRASGLAHRLLAGVVEGLRSRGVERVEAFPRRGEDLPPDDVWTGPEPLFRAAGFAVLREDARRPVYEIAL